MSTFGHYGTFAVLPLYTAIMIDGTYDIDGFIASFRVSGDEHVENPKLGAFMKRLVYETSDTFTTEEIRFFLRMSRVSGPLTDEQIEADKQEMLRYWGPWLLTTLQSQYLLKAVDFWKANYNENCDRWRREFRDARILSDRRLQDDDGYVSGYGAFDGSDSDSDSDSEESEESEESDESDSGIEE
jgi:hypothetical protein